MPFPDRSKTRTRMWALAFVTLLAGTGGAWLYPAAASSAKVRISLPLKSDSVRFAVIGDSGTGDSAQFQVAKEMEDAREQVHFDFAVMLGDNIYGGKSPLDFKQKFEDPYKGLMDAGVRFYASLGNHDVPDERFYKPFNMDGQRYYSYKRGNAEFFALDSSYMDPAQLAWINTRLAGSSAAWKICYFHHPLYSDGKFHGSDVDLRARLEPVFLKYGVNLVLNGHEHVYERIVPQHGIYYFVLGNSGELRPHNLRQRSALMAKGFDTDRTFAIFEVAGDELNFQVISRTGETVDSGALPRQTKDSTSNSNR